MSRQLTLFKPPHEVPDIVSLAHLPFGYLRQPSDIELRNKIEVDGRWVYENKAFDYRWIVTTPEEIGLPVGPENDFEALVYALYVHKGSPDIEIAKTDVMQWLKYPNNGKFNAFVNKAMVKFRRMNINAVNCLVDTKRNKVLRGLDFQFLDYLGLSSSRRYGDVEEIDARDIKSVSSMLEAHRDSVIHMGISKPIINLIERSEGFFMNWEEYVSLDEIKVRKLYRFVNEWRQRGQTEIQIADIGKWMLMSDQRPSKVWRSIEPALNEMKKRGILMAFRRAADNVVIDHRRLKKSQRKEDPMKDQPLYAKLMHQGVLPGPAKKICSSMLWSPEEKELIIEYYDIHKESNNWNAGMLVNLMLKEDYRVELQNWIDQEIERREKPAEPEVEQDKEESAAFIEAISAVKKLPDAEFQALLDTVAGGKDFIAEQLRKAAPHITREELMESVMFRTVLAEAYREGTH